MNNTSRKGTKININIVNIEISVVLNDNWSSKEFLTLLPYTVRLHKYNHDHCGVINEVLEQ